LLYIYNILDTAMSKFALETLMTSLTENTVFGDLLVPIHTALKKVRYRPKQFRTLSMANFIGVAVFRHLQGINSLREQVQALSHFSNEDMEHLILARSTLSDALSSSKRLSIVSEVQKELVQQAKEVLPDRLSDIPGLGSRPVYALDGTYQQESAHYKKCTPSQGGEDNPKGHALLTFYDVRLGCPHDAYVDTRSRHETAMLRDYAKQTNAVTAEKNALWLADRAFVDAPFWDRQKKKLKATVITRMKNNLVIEGTKEREVSDLFLNHNVVLDEEVILKSSSSVWRRVHFLTESGKEMIFLTNDMTLEPGVIAFLYLRRWDEEKCFDTWKNDYSQGKAWGLSIVAIDNQTRLAIITNLLVAMLLNEKMEDWGISDEKALKKREKRIEQNQAEFVPMMWFSDLYRYTAKVSRQALRFLKYCFYKKSSHRLYERQLKPMLLRYI
jgi:hypothetical protein